MTDRAVLLTSVDIDNLFLIFIFIYSSLFYQSMTKSFPFVRIVFIDYLIILYCTELFHFYTFIDRKDIYALLCSASFTLEQQTFN